MSRGEPVAIPVEVVGGDHEKRLVPRERVAVVFADGVPGRRPRDAACPCGNGARGVAGPFAAKRRKVLSQPRDLAGRKFGQRGTGKSAPDEKCGVEVTCSGIPGFHGSHDLVGPQNEYFRDAEMKSRSLSSLPAPA